MGDKLGPVDIEFVLKNLNFKDESQRIRDQIKGISTTAQKEAAETNSILKTMGAGIAAYFSFQAISGFGRELINVRGEFQQLGIALETILGSKEKADALMSQVVSLAAKTPFTLTQVGQGAKQLLAFQVSQDEVIDTLTRLGNIAAGVSVPLDQLIRAYGQVKAKGRLQGDDMRQFTEAGIPLVNELAKAFKVTEGEVYKLVESGKVGFTDVQNIIKGLTDEGGMFFNLMEKQSKSLTGLVSNLGDAWDRMLNDIGTSNEGIIAGGIQGLTNLVNNYQGVLDVIKVLVATYGAYKAVLIATAVVQKSVAAITFIQEYLQMGKALGFATANQIAFNKASLANPYALAAAAIAALVTSLMLFSKEATAAEKAQQKLNDIRDKAAAGADGEEAKIRVLVTTLQSETATRNEKNRAIEELNRLSPDMLGNLTAENIGTEQAKIAIDEYIESVRKKIEIQEIEKELAESIKRQRIVNDSGADVSFSDNLWNSFLLKIGAYRKLANNAITIQNDALKDEVELQKQLQKELEGLFNNAPTTTINKKSPEPTKSRTVAVIDAEISALKKEQAELAKTKAEWENYSKRLTSLEKEKESITGVTKEKKETVKEDKSNKDYLNNILSETSTYNQKRIALEFTYQQKRKALVEAGATENIAQLDRLHKEELDALEADNLKKSESYRWVYDDIDKMGKQYLQGYINRLKVEIEAFRGNDEVKLELTKKLAEAENELMVKAPLASLKVLNSKITEIRSKIKVATTEADKAKLQAELAQATSQKASIISDQFQNAANILGSMSELASQFDEQLGETINTVGKLASSIGSAVANFSSGNIVGGITSTISVLSSVVKLFNGEEEEKYSEKLAKWIQKLVKVLELQEKSLSILNQKDQINEYTNLIQTADESLQQLLEKAQKRLDKVNGLMNTLFDKDIFENWGVSSDVSSWTSDDWLLAISKAGGDAKDTLQELYEEWIALQEQQQEYINAQNELITGTTYDSIVSSITDGFSDGLDSAADFADTFEEMMKDAMLQSLSVNYLEGKVQDWYNLFAAYNKDGILTAEEKAALQASWNALIEGANDYASALETATGITLGESSTSSDNTLSGAYQSMDQETANLLAGINGAILIHVADIASAVTGKFNDDLKAAFGSEDLQSTFGLGLSTINQSIIKSNEYLAKIEANTQLLADIKTLLSTSSKESNALFYNNRIKGW